MIIHKRNKAFSFKEMSVDMHHGLAMWADWSFNFCIGKDRDIHFLPPVECPNRGF